MKKTLAAALALIMALAAFTGCSDKDSSSGSKSGSLPTSSAAQTGGTAEPVPADKVPDVMGALTGDGGSEVIGMTKEDFDKATDNSFTEKTAIEYEDGGDGDIYAEFSLGKSDSILGGRVALGKEYDIVSTLSFKGGKLIKYTEKIRNIEKEEADKISETFLKAFDGKLPEGYTQATPVEHGSKREVGFTKGIHDYCISMNRDKNLDDEYYLTFALEKYDERYGM